MADGFHVCTRSLVSPSVLTLLVSSFTDKEREVGRNAF